MPSVIGNAVWRWLVLLHRWVSVLLCLLFVAWFASGLAIIYVKFPELSAAEQRAAAASIDIMALQLTPGAAVARLRAGDFDKAGSALATRRLPVTDPQAHLLEVSSMRIGMLFGRPIYRVDVPDRQPRVVFADNGELLGEVTADMALRAARDFAQRAGLVSSKSVVQVPMIHADQWSISGSLHEHRPLHRVALNDAAGTELYISSSTGQVVRDTRRTERMLNYFAAITHWLYPIALRRYPERWSWTVNVLAGVGTMLAISGLWLGAARWQRYSRAQSISPYRGLMRWHHLTGLVFGLTALSWVFSGWLSMNPGSLNPDESPSTEEALVFAGTPLMPSDFKLLSLPAAEPIDVELLHFERQPLYRITTRSGAVMLQSAGGEPGGRLPSVAAMVQRAPRLLPDAVLVHTTVLREFDEYYYSRHQAGGEALLPVLRLQFNDTARTWFYVDAATGRILARSTHRNRVYRWLYNGLHSFDFKWLRERRPLWDVVVLSFCLGGLVLSSIGTIAATRRLRREADAWLR
jgi:hypothetical protein